MGPSSPPAPSPTLCKKCYKTQAKLPPGWQSWAVPRLSHSFGFSLTFETCCTENKKRKKYLFKFGALFMYKNSLTVATSWRLELAPG